MVERVSGYDGVELVVGEHELATAPAIQHLDDMLERRVGANRSSTSSGGGTSSGSICWSIGACSSLVPRPRWSRGPRSTRWSSSARVRGPHDHWGGGTTSFTVADLGTGSGAIALALASELPDAEVWATDVSDDALAVARANLAGVGSVATRVRLERGSWFEALPPELRGALRLVVSNPPYVAEHEVVELPADVADWEPRDALVSGPSGLEAHRDDRARGARVARSRRQRAGGGARAAPGGAERASSRPRSGSRPST